MAGGTAATVLGDPDAFRDAAEQSGIAPVDDFNGGDNAGCGYFEVNQRGGLRWNTAKAFYARCANAPTSPC